ncbi:MAG TPA: M20/M25/M40 family metallo-hydrolase [Vicinamibacterales bacterium]|nr:M20/M25/M40 family metallo-hydrolase [Vicinamibacterales bacterium]
MTVDARRARCAPVTAVCLLALLAWLDPRGVERPEAAARGPAVEDAGPISHALAVSIDPSRHRLSATDVVRLPGRPPAGRVEFLLNGALSITSSEPPVREVPLGDTSPFHGLNTGPGEDVPPLKRYSAVLPEGDAVLSLAYEGAVDFALSPEKEQYTRGFRQTAGTIGAEGVYLAGAGFWYPQFGPGLISFTLEVSQPDGWHAVSQGNGTSRDAGGTARWDSAGPTDEIYLVGGPLRVFRDRAGPVETLVYLHEPDQGLAAKYLEATGQYIDMYRRLIGPYPYGKFALVENFWETGYGMPSFTLLGREVIRFPFILASSYPHEILHNWWGNSVFVDFASGNWSEGLTAYLADHLIQEQRGAGAEYRRATLQKYRNYVRDGRDFPLTEFRARESAATEAVGYGKTLMAFHMLRRSVGDDVFRKALARFYRDFKGRRASFDDLRRTFESESGRDLARFFRDWIERAGAPALAVTARRMRVDQAAAAAAPASAAAGWSVAGTLRQTQGGPAFAVDVPIAIRTASGVERRVVRMAGAEQTFAFETASEPLALHADPDFDVFRRLDPRETPASIGQIFGEPHVLAIVPASAPEREQRAWRELFEGWGSPSHKVEVRTDREVASLPPDRAVWIAGRGNALAGRVLESAGLGQSGGFVELDGQRIPLAAHTLVVVARHPATAEKAVGWLAVDPIEAFPGLGRKLPHYGKYSYLAFEGAEPANTVKGQWTPADSPMTVRLRDPGGSSEAGSARLAALEPERRKPLIELPPAFSERSLEAHVAFLADPARGGRMPGTGGHDEAARYIAERFKDIGLAPGGDEGGYLQEFTLPGGPAWKSAGGTRAAASNVIGYIPGTRADWKGQSVVVSAHYDHLGAGWPDVHKGDEGKVHPGADDNASGVAVMLELARLLASSSPARSIVFIAFSGEEAGRLGSRHYVERAAAFPARQAIGVINLDTVGRLGPRPVSVLGTATASEWQHIFRGASFVTGVESLNVPAPPEASDQASFTALGVPGVHLFAGAHADYHRPTDTADKIDLAGLVKVAALAREAIAYLAERAEPLTAPADSAASRPPAAGERTGGGERRAGVGTVPDFAFEGPGVRVASVVAGSPAERAGIQAGDVLTAIDGREVADLRGYSELLRALKPGQKVRVVLVRGGKEQALEVILGER